VASSFVGREADVAAITTRLEDARLVTVLGPGGIGKTRLAHRVAEERVAAFSAHEGGGVWFFRLDEARGPSDIVSIVSVVAASLGVVLEGHDGSGASVSHALGRALARRGRILVVLDNFERLVDHASATVGLWLTLAPSARFLVTSRVALELEGEELWSLAPLPEKEAIELFMRRAKQVQSALSIENGARVALEIVNAIDRMPLASELAASRTKVLSGDSPRPWDEAQPF
jgi:predicted ATPase